MRVTHIFFIFILFLQFNVQYLYGIGICLLEWYVYAIVKIFQLCRHDQLLDDGENRLLLYERNET